MSVALVPATTFKVAGPNKHPTDFDKLEDAVEAARGLVYLSSRQVDIHVKRLKAGQSTYWTYGFSTVHIEVTK